MSDVATALTDALGSAVLVGDDERRARARDTWARSEIDDWRGQPGPLPVAVVRPSSVEAMATAVRICREHRTPMVPRGLGSGVVGGVLATADSVVLSTEAMTGLRRLDTENLLATFGAGTCGLDAEDLVAAEGFTIGNWPQSIEISTVGGWVATRASGQYSTAYGNTEDLVYSLEAVLSDGTIYRSPDTPRASTGPDLRQLLLGSEGTLGVVTEVTFSLFTKPAASVRQAFHFAEFAAGITAIGEVIRRGWRPPVVRLYDGRESWRHFEGTLPKGDCMLIFLHDGPEGRPQLEAGSVAEICSSRDGRAAASDVVDRWFEQRNTVPSWSELYEQGVVADTIEVATTWTELAGLYDDVVAAVSAVPGVVSITAHSSHAYRSGANLYFTFAAIPSGPDEMTSTYDACWAAAMQATTARGAGIGHHHGVGRVRRAWMADELGDAGLAVLRAVKRSLDPDDLMNPGVLVPASTT